MEHLVVLVIPLALVFAVVHDRWRRFGGWLTFLLMLVIFIVPWLLYYLSFTGSYKFASELTFLFLPHSTLIGLYWIRWWAIRPPRIFSDLAITTRNSYLVTRHFHPMSSRTYLFLFLFGLVVTSVISYFEPIPGYLDSDYYYAGGIQLATGKGFTEPYLWNYLDGDPRFRTRHIVIGLRFPPSSPPWECGSRDRRLLLRRGSSSS